MTSGIAVFSSIELPATDGVTSPSEEAIVHPIQKLQHEWLDGLDSLLSRGQQLIDQARQPNEPVSDLPRETLSSEPLGSEGQPWIDADFQSDSSDGASVTRLSSTSRHRLLQEQWRPKIPKKLTNG